MKQIMLKEVPVKLEQDYLNLREHVLRRDSWRCQVCGSMTNLEVHHKQFRSHSGEDQEDNLITLCFNCHSSLHRSRPVTRDVYSGRSAPGLKRD